MSAEQDAIDTILSEQAYPPEIRAMMGVHMLFWKLEDCIESINAEPLLTKQERHMVVRLDSPRRMGVLARDMSALPSTVTAVADGLEARGFLTRERDPDDRRAWRLRLTDSGFEIRNQLLAKAGEIFSDISGLDAEETKVFAALAEKIRLHILKSGVPKGMKYEDS